MSMFNKSKSKFFLSAIYSAMVASITVAASVIFDEYVLDSLTAITKINKSDT